MFERPGGKIKRVANILFWVDVAFAIVDCLTCFVVALTDFAELWWMFFAGIGIAIGTVGVSYIVSLCLYAYGDMAQDIADSNVEITSIGYDVATLAKNSKVEKNNEQ